MVFAQITDMESYEPCSGEEGMMGLGLAALRSVDYSNLLDGLTDQLANPMMSLYFNSGTDDYDDDGGFLDLDDKAFEVEEDDGGNLEFNFDFSGLLAGSHAATANSAMTLGGVNYKYYEGCLNWHPLADAPEAVDGESLDGFWIFNLDSVRAGEHELTTGGLAIVDSGSTLLIGPVDAVGKYAASNGMQCFDMTWDEPTPVDCDNAEGFDLAVKDCNEPMTDLELVANGVTYPIYGEELLEEVDTFAGAVCVLQLAMNMELEGWILGDTFLSRHYATFDWGQKRIGLAPISQGEGGPCEAEWEFDVNNNGQPMPPVKAPTPRVSIPHPAKSPKTPASQSKPASSSPASTPPMVMPTASDFLSYFAGLGVVIAGVLIVVHLAQRRRRYNRVMQLHGEDGLMESDLTFGEVELPDMS